MQECIRKRDNQGLKGKQMLKLQQFNIISLNYNRLKNNNFDLTLSNSEAFANEEIISLADSEFLRAIRRITSHKFNKEKLDVLVKERKKLKNANNSLENRLEIKRLNAQISSMLFIKDVVCVQTENKKDYVKFCPNGFKVNGIKYKRFICGASHARTNRALFVNEEIFDELYNILFCEADKSLKVNLAKYNAYFALTSSATWQVSRPRFCVIPDKEIEMEKDVEWVDKDDNITQTKKAFTFNVFDGMGLISPKLAKSWANEIGCNYLPSWFVVRSPYIKGLVAVFDFHKFGEEIAKSDCITDIYGKVHNVKDIDLILTQSQFKFWNGYKDIDDYNKKLSNSGISWGVAKFATNEIKEYRRTNYQFLQVLNLTDKDIEDVCQYTVDWVKNISGANYDVSQETINHTLLYLLGKIAQTTEPQKVWGAIQEPYVKALMLDNTLIKDKYISGRIIKSINKKIEEAYFGKLLIKANVQEIMADVYALAEHAFGLEVKGLLSEFQHYSNYWNNYNVKEVVAMRSPLTWRSEVNKLNLQRTEEMEEWYKYIKCGIIYNIWGVDNMLQAGSDYDGDSVMTTDNPVFLRCRYGGTPVAYQPQKANKETIDISKLYKIDALSFNTQIGYITNLSTTLYSMLPLFEKGSAEYEEIIKRLKLCCILQSECIDSAKGINFRGVPKEWTTWQKGDSEYDKLCNKLIIDKRPYFMRNLYTHYNKTYKSAMVDANRISRCLFGKSYNELLQQEALTEEEQRLVDRFNRVGGLLRSDSGMNKICYQMEKELSYIRKLPSSYKNIDIYSILHNDEIEFTEEQYNKMVLLKKEYNSYKQNKKCANGSNETYEQFYKGIKQKAMETISNNIKELANIAVEVCYKEKSASKEFCWDCFGDGIVENLTQKKDKVNVPVLSEIGDTEYLGKTYTTTELNLTDTTTEINDFQTFNIDYDIETMMEILGKDDKPTEEDLDDLWSDIDDNI